MKDNNISKIILGATIITAAIAGVGYIINKSKKEKENKEEQIIMEIPFSDEPLTTEEMLDLELDLHSNNEIM